MSTIKISYPSGTGPNKPSVTKAPLEEWERIRQQIKAALKEGISNQRQLIDYYTQEYSSGARARFEQWMRQQDAPQSYDIKIKGINQMEKVAATPEPIDKDKALEDLKKALKSRCNSITKYLDDAHRKRLAPTDTIRNLGRIVFRLREEIDTLERPNLLAASLRGKKRIFASHNFIPGIEEIEAALHDIEAITNSQQLIKTAQIETTELIKTMDLIREEMDMLNYGVHLEQLFEIMRKLKKLGRNSEADAIEKVIQKELPSLDSLVKKLVDIYTSLSQISITEFTKKKPIESKPEEIPVKQESELATKPTKTPEVAKPKEESFELGKPATSMV